MLARRAGECRIVRCEAGVHDHDKKKGRAQGAAEGTNVGNGCAPKQENKHRLTGLRASMVLCFADVVVQTTVLSKRRWGGGARESLGAFVPELRVLDLADNPANR